MQYLEFFKNYTWWNNTAYDYVMALGIFIGLLIVLKIFQVIILARLQVLAKKTATDFDDTLISIFKTIKPPFYFFIALYFGIKVLTLPHTLLLVIKVLVWIALVYEIIRAVEKMVGYFIKKHFIKTEDETSHVQAVAKILQVIIRISLWLVGLILIFSNLGINVTSLLASLGIGGLAIALAMQNILSDLFSSFSIYIDKPFQVGDFIVVGTDMGTVEKIGLKTTRLRTLHGEELVIANKELTSARVQNFKKMERRRVLFNLGVTYNTPEKKLALIPEMVKKIIDQIDGVEFDRCHFASYGDFSLNFEIVYYVNSADYNNYMDLKHQINLAIHEAFAKAKIDFAYPTQTVYVSK